jgi:hypothetical protein
MHCKRGVHLRKQPEYLFRWVEGRLAVRWSISENQLTWLLSKSCECPLHYPLSRARLRRCVVSTVFRNIPLFSFNVKGQSAIPLSSKRLRGWGSWMAFKGSSRASELGTDNSYTPITIDRGCRQTGVYVYNPPLLWQAICASTATVWTGFIASQIYSARPQCHAMRRLTFASLVVRETSFTPRLWFSTPKNHFHPRLSIINSRLKSSIPLEVFNPAWSLQPR